MKSSIFCRLLEGEVVEAKEMEVRREMWGSGQDPIARVDLAVCSVQSLVPTHTDGLGQSQVPTAHEVDVAFAG